MSRSRVVMVMVAGGVAVAPRPARAEPSYIEKFLGWSKDNAWFAITESGTDETDFPALCLTRRGDKPASWPAGIAAPAADDDRGCTDLLDDQTTPPQAAVARIQKLVVAPTTAATGPHGETVAVKAVADGSIAGVTIARGGKPIGRGYFFLRRKDVGVPDQLTARWRGDGLAVAVEAAYPPGPPGNPGFGPPAYLVVIALDGSTANLARPSTAREQSQALNLAGMKALKAAHLDDAQRQFVAATQTDPTYSIPAYNLASVASLRKDSNTAVAAIQAVIALAGSDPEAKRALDHGKVDHDLDFVAGQSPYVAQLLGRPRTRGDDWCIAAETRARGLNEGMFIGLAAEVGLLMDATAKHASIPAGHDPEFSCAVGTGTSQLSVEMTITLDPDAGTDRWATIAWEIFSNGLFDADGFPPAKRSPSLRLQKLARIASMSGAIASGKSP